MEDKDFKSRILDILKNKKMTKADLFRNTNLKRSTLYNVFDEKTNPNNLNLETVKEIAHALNVSVEYLVYGGSLAPNNKQAIRIPVLGSIPAGIPLDAIEDIIDYEEISEEMAKAGEYFGLLVKGDSMSPRILDKDIVIIRKQDDAESGKICVFMINGNEATLKQLKKEMNGIWILPFNPNSSFQPTFYTNQEVEELPVRILGIAVEIRRTM